MSAEDTRVFFFYIIDIKMGSMCPQNNFLYVLCQFCEQIHKTVSSFRRGLSTVHLRSQHLKRMFTSHLGRNLKLGFHGSLRLQDMVPTCDKNILPPYILTVHHRFPLIYIFVSILICNWVKGHSYTNIHQRLITTLYRGRCVHFTLFMKDYNDVMDVKLLNEANRYHLMWGINHLRIRHLKLIYTLLPIPKRI